MTISRSSIKGRMRLTLSSLVVYAYALLPGTAFAQSNYVAFELERENNWEQQLAFEDLNGDGLKDIIHANYQTGIGRELHVFHQQADGSFSTTAQRIEIKTEIIAVAFADIRATPGTELLLISNSGVFSLSSSLEGYRGNIKQLLEWELIAAVPDLETVQFITNLQDIDKDGEIDLLLPGDGVYGLFKGRGNEVFELVSTFSTDNDSLSAAQRGGSNSGMNARIGINAKEGVVIELNVESNSYFDGFVEQWDASEEPARSLLRSESWMPTAITAQLNADTLIDIAYINQGADGVGQLNFHFQDAQNGFNSEPDWTGSIDTRGDIQLVDMDNDNLLDLLRITGEGNDRSAYFYRNQNGSFDLEQPNQVMRFSGYDVRLNLIPLEQGSKALLNVSYYTIPVIDAIRNASINRSQLLFGSDNAGENQFFNRRPDSKLDESFSAANVRGLSEQMSLQYDIDGDGRKDAIFVTENGTLAAKKINEDLTIESEPFWEYVSANTVFEFQVLQLNQDSKPDLLLRHGTSTTFLVAAP
ncbi:MAG: VCBS repeat-containing protein [Gammaproteobacteria bacterium]|nr:VCBS repeat-containing protein [Gammaproteobacteria bacterium]